MVNAIPQFFLPVILIAEILACAEQSRKKVGGLYNIATVIRVTERNGPACPSIQPMREDAVVVSSPCKEVYYFDQPMNGLLPADPFSLCPHDDSHNAEA